MRAVVSDEKPTYKFYETRRHRKQEKTWFCCWTFQLKYRLLTRLSNHIGGGEVRREKRHKRRSTDIPICVGRHSMKEKEEETN